MSHYLPIWHWAPFVVGFYQVEDKIVAHTVVCSDMYTSLWGKNASCDYFRAEV